MKNYLFLLSKDLENNLILSLFQSNFVTLFILSLFLFIFLFGEKLVFLFEKTWNNLYDRIYDPADSNDPFSDFVSLDQNVVQVITDTKIKFEDVAGNEEAKEELKEVVKFLKEPETFSKLGAGVPKGGQFDMNRMSAMMNQNAQKDKLKSKLEQRRNAAMAAAASAQANYTLESTAPNEFVFKLPEDGVQEKSKAPVAPINDDWLDDEPTPVQQNKGKGKAKGKKGKKGK
jgi:hypothetical protein